MLFVFLCGACIASFTQVIAYRYPNNPFIPMRSHCSTCHHTLKWYDLMPILSFVWLRGKCRYCHQTLHWYDPVVECMGGLLLIYALRLWQWNNTDAMKWLLIFYPLFLFSQIDIVHRIVPNTWIGLWGIILMMQLFLTQQLSSTNIGFAIGFLVCYSLFDYYFPNKIGGADIKLLAMMTLYLSPYVTFLALSYACAIACLFIICTQVLCQKTIPMIPFVPFLLIGTICAHYTIFFHNH